MTQRRPFVTKAAIERAAEIATRLRVSVRLDADGSVTISPSRANANRKTQEGGEFDRELEELHARRSDFVPWPGPDLSHREERVLKVLIGAHGRPIAASGIPLAGPHTVNGLLSHGLVALEDGMTIFNREQMIHATAAGLAFFKRRSEHRRKYPAL